MGRHSDERDTASNGPHLPAQPTGDGSGTRGGSDASADAWEALELPEDDDCGLWDLRTCLRRWEWYGDDTRPPRAVVNVELPEDPT